MGTLLDRAGIGRGEVVLWNVVPCISTVDRNRNASLRNIIDAALDTQSFIASLSRLEAIVYCGRKAQCAIKLVEVPSWVRTFTTFHPGAMATIAGVYGRTCTPRLLQLPIFSRIEKKRSVTL